MLLKNEYNLNVESDSDTDMNFTESLLRPFLGPALVEAIFSTNLKKYGDILAQLKSYHPYSDIFLQKVSKREVPNYYDIILEPMDLGTMAKKIKKYEDPRKFKSDLDLIWSNCCRFNGPSIFADYAQKMKEKADTLFEKYFRAILEAKKDALGISNSIRNKSTELLAMRDVSAANNSTNVPENQPSVMNASSLKLKFIIPKDSPILSRVKNTARYSFTVENNDLKQEFPKGPVFRFCLPLPGERLSQIVRQGLLIEEKTSESFVKTTSLAVNNTHLQRKLPGIHTEELKHMDKLLVKAFSISKTFHLVKASLKPGFKDDLDPLIAFISHRQSQIHKCLSSVYLICKKTQQPIPDIFTRNKTVHASGYFLNQAHSKSIEFPDLIFLRRERHKVFLYKQFIYENSFESLRFYFDFRFKNKISTQNVSKLNQDFHEIFKNDHNSCISQKTKANHTKNTHNNNGYKIFNSFLAHILSSFAHFAFSDEQRNFFIKNATVSSLVPRLDKNQASDDKNAKAQIYLPGCTYNCDQDRLLLQNKNIKENSEHQSILRKNFLSSDQSISFEHFSSDLGTDGVYIQEKAEIIKKLLYNKKIFTLMIFKALNNNAGEKSSVDQNKNLETGLQRKPSLKSMEKNKEDVFLFPKIKIHKNKQPRTGAGMQKYYENRENIPEIFYQNNMFPDYDYPKFFTEYDLDDAKFDYQKIKIYNHEIFLNVKTTHEFDFKTVCMNEGHIKRILEQISLICLAKIGYNRVLGSAVGIFTDFMYNWILKACYRIKSFAEENKNEVRLGLEDVLRVYSVPKVYDVTFGEFKNSQEDLSEVSGEEESEISSEETIDP